jgi:hypothetical protein
MLNSLKRAKILLVSLLLMSNSCFWLLPGLAYKSSIAAVHIMNKLENGDNADPNISSTFLLDMAKAIARWGLPQGFFLTSDTYANQPAIDLRLLLLYDSGLVKVPLKVVLPNKGSKTDAPTLQHKIIPDPIAGNLVQGKEAEKNKQEKKVEQTSSNNDASISYNLGGLEKQTDEDKGKQKVNDNYIAYTSPSILTEKATRVDVEGANEHVFRLWTYRPNKIAQPVLPSYINKTDQEFKGSFIISSCRIKSINGRKLVVADGSLLVSVKGEPISIQTINSLITLEPGTTTLMSLSDLDLIKIIELPKKQSIEILLKGKTKSNDINCLIGDAISINGNKIDKTRLSISEMLDKEPLLQLNDKIAGEEFSAIKQLRERIK